MHASGKASKVDLRGWASIYIYIHIVFIVFIFYYVHNVGS